MLIGILVPLKGLSEHDGLPDLHGDLQFAAAVPADIVDALRRVGVLHQGPGRSRLPHTDHGDHRQHPARQIDQNKVFLPDPVFLQPPVDPPGHIVQTGISDALGVGIVKQDRGVGIRRGVTPQPFNDRFHDLSPVKLLLDIRK